MNFKNHRKTALLLFAICLGSGAHAATAGDENCRVVIPGMDDDDSLKWTGPCVDGYADGNGVLQLFTRKKDVGSFEGRMARGLPVDGYQKLPGGAQYEGHFDQGLRDGPGTFVNAAGDTYTGMWKAGLKHGKGTMRYVMGGEFSGEWADDKPVGIGAIKYAGGQRAEEQAVFPSQPVVPGEAKQFQLKAERKKKFGEIRPVDYGPVGSIPYDKTYEQLSPEQKAAVRRSYPLLHPDDEPPFPAHGIAEVSKLMYRWQQSVLVDGRLVFRVLVDSSGRAKSVTFLETPDPKLNELIILIMSRTPFKPARCAGVACEMFYPFSFAFETR